MKFQLGFQPLRGKRRYRLLTIVKAATVKSSRAKIARQRRRKLWHELGLSVQLDWMLDKRQSKSRTSRGENKRHRNRRTSEREKECSDDNKGRLCSHDITFLSPRGHMLSHTKSKTVKVMRTKYKHKFQTNACTRTCTFEAQVGFLCTALMLLILF